jgi:hypothetical protein
MRFHYLLLMTSTLLGAAACGGKVVVDGSPDDKVGAAGGTTTTSTSASTSSSTQAPTSSGSGSTDPLCIPLCEAVVAGGCAGDECVGQCAKTLAAVPECHDAAQAAASCIQVHSADFPGCSVHPCDQLMSTYLDCATKSKCNAGVVGGLGDTPGCIGKALCTGNVNEWIAECDESGACRCEIDNNVIGTCQETGPFLCDLMWGCCEPFFLPLF